jgi:hypothetical protein
MGNQLPLFACSAPSMNEPAYRTMVPALMIL